MCCNANVYDVKLRSHCVALHLTSMTSKTLHWRRRQYNLAENCVQSLRNTSKCCYGASRKRKIVKIENSHFLENFVTLPTEEKKFSKKFSRFRHVRLEEGLFFDYKNGHYKKMSRQIFLIFCNLMRNMTRNKKMSGSEKVNTGHKRCSKSARSPVFAHNRPLVASKKALKNFFPRYLKM